MPPASPVFRCYYVGICYIVCLAPLYMRDLGYKCPIRTRLHILSKHSTTTSPTVTYLIHYIQHNSNRRSCRTVVKELPIKQRLELPRMLIVCPQNLGGILWLFLLLIVRGEHHLRLARQSGGPEDCGWWLHELEL